jgi:2-polyprenyl-3-methyl-5-hydroxy-6-metoxy-1,4-benzoquinol methylase
MRPAAADSGTEFRVARGAREDGVVVGNVFDKYGSRNPIVRALMKGFGAALEELVAMTGARAVHEVGCGEGYWTLRWAQRGLAARGSDFSSQVVEVARANAVRAGLPADFRVASVYDLAPPDDSAPLVVCCEVLEHLEEPRRALERLCRIASPWLIVSVPREPIWRAMNMARGCYWADWGNTPGHLQHWSSAELCALLGERAEVVAVRRPLPWTMALCRC